LVKVCVNDEIGFRSARVGHKSLTLELYDNVI